MKKVISVFMCSFAVVVAEDKVDDVFSGFGAGLGIGYNLMKYDIKEPPVWPGWRSLGDASMKMNNVYPCLGLGGGKTFGQSFYIGLDLLADFSDSKTTFHRDYAVTGAAGHTVYVNGRFGLLPFLNKKTMLYVKCGIAFRRGIDVYRTTHTLYGRKYLLDVKQQKNVLFFGAGLERAIYPNISIRLEADFLPKKSFEVSNGNVSQGKWESKGKASEKSFRLLVWYTMPAEYFK